MCDIDIHDSEVNQDICKLCINKRHINCKLCNKLIYKFIEGQKYCNMLCYQTSRNTVKNIVKKSVICKLCNTTFITNREEQQFCNISCSNRYIATLPKSKYFRKNILIPIECKLCKKSFQPVSSKIKFCSKPCHNDFLRLPENYEERRRIGSIGGRISAKNQCRRSKNEIYFYELCLELFPEAIHNEPIFNGWDADVILPKIKIAILWNGIWHYQKVRENHSVEQVQTRDKYKLKQIVKCGFVPYIIKDMGKHNKKFVEAEFQKFKDYVYFT